LLPLVDEAVGAGILRAGEEDLAFRHKLIWRAVIEAGAHRYGGGPP